jgi:methionyl aminopeptidase
MEINDYIKAGKIAGEVRENVRKKNWVGSTVFEICEEVENEIKKRGAKCAFPVNTSINEVAAHYTAEPNDELTISDTDLVKIDLGAQINGYIADTAVTVCYDSQFDMLVKTAEDALNDAMSMMKVGVKSSDVGKTIEKRIKQMGFLPIANLSGHSLEQYTIHAGKSVPNIWSIGSFRFSEEAFACEPFVTTGEGLGFVHEGKIKNIFALSTRKKYFLFFLHVQILVPHQLSQMAHMQMLLQRIEMIQLTRYLELIFQHEWYIVQVNDR